jgi:type I restriction enzyme S subunit
LRFDEFTEEGPYLVTGTDFREGKVDWATCYHLPEERYQEDPFIQLREGDLLITKDGTIGKIAVVRDMPGPASLNSGVFVTRALRPVYRTGYMYWVLCSDAFAGFIEKKSGTTIAHPINMCSLSSAIRLRRQTSSGHRRIRPRDHENHY